MRYFGPAMSGGPATNELPKGGSSASPHGCTTRAVRRSLIAASVLATSLSCAREAPGPRECQELALSVVGVTDPRTLGHPAVKAEVDSWTTRCLTTPYDRELLACVKRGERGCYQAFAERHPDRAERDARRIRE